MKYGRFHLEESPSTLAANLHISQQNPEALKSVSWTPALAVLDQEDLVSQGIDTSRLISGAAKVDALGSCTAQATTCALAAILEQETFFQLLGKVSESPERIESYQDTRHAEEFAICFYHFCTDQTGTPSQEWPPTDCGSTGAYVVQALESLKLIQGAHIGGNAESLISLLQKGGVLIGSPWLSAWEEPDADGFIDGNGSSSTLEEQIQRGIAGGHETYIWAIEKLVFNEAGEIDPYNTILIIRNSWSKSWGDEGNCRVHLSTLLSLQSQIDFRQIY